MKVTNQILLTFSILFTVNVNADTFFNFEASTPVGSWAVKEVTTTDHKGRETVAVTRQKYLGSEEHEGETYIWLETEMDNFKVKKEKRKRDGEHIVMKVLMAKSLMNSDPANVLNNLQGVGKKIILQTGEGNPIEISDGGMFAKVALKALGTEMNYSFTQDGSETLDTAMGKIETTRIAGSGSSSTKILFKKIEVQSQSMMWVSDDVPFGMVKMESTDLVNGKEQTSSSILTEFGTSGAVTAITGEVQEMPF